jgi:glycosyltransferase involved in cell wall biosynthesis
MLVRYYGHVGGESGYGQAANETCMAMLEAGIELEISTDGKQLRAPYLPLSTRIRSTPDLSPEPDAVIVHTLPLDCAKLMQRIDFPARRRLIAYTTWEGSSRVSADAAKALARFERVWVPSAVTQRLTEGAGFPVDVVPHAFDNALTGRSHKPCPTCCDFHVLDGFPPGTSVTTPGGPGTVREWTQYGSAVRVRVQHETDRENYDPCQLTADRVGPYRFYYIGAWAARKNPDGVIQAYLREFTPEDDVELLIQSSGAGDSACAVTQIATGLTMEEMPTIRYSNQRVTDAQIRSLHRESHCFVTATRGEAWNLPAFDAMMAGRHVIAPAGMGSDDFLMGTSADRYSSRIVPAGGEVRLVADPMAPPGHATAVYFGTQGLTVRSNWREPDIEELGCLMRQAYTDNKTTLRMNYDPAARYSRKAVGTLIRNLLEGATK